MVCNNTFYNIKEHKQLILLNVCDNESQFKLRKKLYIKTKRPRDHITQKTNKTHNSDQI